MRLGDLDALKEQIRGFGLSYDNNLEFVLDAIDNAPTVRTGDCEDCPYCPNSNSGIPIGVE